ncbi:MAG: tetratricopeptide repeat protein [Bacillota bacterium]
MLKNLLLLFVISVFAYTLNGCSGKSEKDLLDSAQNNIKNKKVTEAINDYEMIAKEYPKSETASKALFEIAKLYHSKSAGIYPDESLKRGIRYYKRIYDEYPGSKEAPQALFMVGFIQANDFGQFDSAKAAYKLFLEKYPNNEMASSAKAELDNMGLTPQEILTKSAQAKK